MRFNAPFQKTIKEIKVLYSQNAREPSYGYRFSQGLTLYTRTYQLIMKIQFLIGKKKQA